jgi:hypothetical protein
MNTRFGNFLTVLFKYQKAFLESVTQGEDKAEATKKKLYRIKNSAYWKARFVVLHELNKLTDKELALFREAIVYMVKTYAYSCPGRDDWARLYLKLWDKSWEK